MNVRDALRFETWAGRLTGRRLQILVLTRHFFGRLFLNDVFRFEEQMKEKLYMVLAMIAPLGWILCTILFSQYLFVADTGQSWAEKMALLFYFMTLLAFAAVLEWDVLFLDSRDYLNLVPLPISPGTLFRAKFASFIVFVFLFSASANAMSVVAINMFLPGWLGGGLNSIFLYTAAQILSSTAAFLFVFLLILFLQAVLMTVLPQRAFRAVSLVVRFALAVGGVFILVALLVAPQNLARMIQSIVVLRRTQPTSTLLFPPMWFTSMYEILIGRGEPLYAAGANIGLAAILVLLPASFFGMAASYRRQTRRSLEVRSHRRMLAGARNFLAGVFDRIFLRNSIQRAIFHFSAGTLRKSPAHKARLAGYLAFSAGFLLILLGAPKTVFGPPAKAGLNVLAAPLFMALMMLLGLRSGMNIPMAADANWVFRLTEAEDHQSYFTALKKAVFFLLLLPFFTLAFAPFAWLWGAGPAALHVLYGLAWALIAREAMFWRYARIPFACLVVPGKSKLYSRWLPYVLGAFLSLSAIATLERALFRSPRGFPVFFCAAAAVLVALNVVQRLFVYKKMAIVYEEEPEPVMITL